MQGLAGNYNNYVNTGNQALGQFYGGLQGMMNDPTGLMNRLASNYRASPYATTQLHDVTNLMNNNAATTGMLGSSADNRALGQQLTNMNNQYMDQYINQGMDAYNRALSGMGGIANMGLGALGQQSGLSQEGYLGQAQGAMGNRNSLLGKLGDLFSKFL